MVCARFGGAAGSIEDPISRCNRGDMLMDLPSPSISCLPNGDPARDLGTCPLGKPSLVLVTDSGNFSKDGRMVPPVDIKYNSSSLCLGLWHSSSELLGLPAMFGEALSLVSQFPEFSIINRFLIDMKQAIAKEVRLRRKTTRKDLPSRVSDERVSPDQSCSHC